MQASSVQLIAVDDMDTREAARGLIAEYLRWIARAVAESYGVSFDVDAVAGPSQSVPTLLGSGERLFDSVGDTPARPRTRADGRHAESHASQVCEALSSMLAAP